MLNIYRELIKSFPKFMGFDGWMIAKAEFKITKQTGVIYIKNDKTAGGLPDVENKIIKQRKNYSVIMAGMVYKGMEYSVIMHIIKPAGINFAKDGFKQVTEVLPSYVDSSVYLFSSCYSKLCIKEFTEFTDDSNYIHQMERPVVPGFLMFEDALGKGFCLNNNDDIPRSFTMVFRKPVFADEVINLYKTGDNKVFAMPAQGHRYILWELECF